MYWYPEHMNLVSIPAHATPALLPEQLLNLRGISASLLLLMLSLQKIHALCFWVFVMQSTYIFSGTLFCAVFLVMVYEDVYDAYNAIEKQLVEERKRQVQQASEEANEQRLDELPALQSMMMLMKQKRQRNESSVSSSISAGPATVDGFYRMNQCRKALDALDMAGWKRSYHQRMFHEAYLAACARPFWKLDPPGSFARAHQKILDVNGWESLAQVHFWLLFLFVNLSSTGGTLPITDCALGTFGGQSSSLVADS